MKEQLEKIKSEALAKIDASDALEKLNEIRVAYLGKKGELTIVLKSMKDVAPEERPKVGQMVNEVRALIEERLEETKTALARKAREEQMKREVIDVTLPAKKANIGHKPSQHHCPGGSGADLRGHGLRGGRRTGGGIRSVQL